MKDHEITQNLPTAGEQINESTGTSIGDIDQNKKEEENTNSDYEYSDKEEHQDSQNKIAEQTSIQ